MENINAEIFTLRNQRKIIRTLIDKLSKILGQFDKLENELVKAQYKHGILIAFDEIGYDEEKFEQRLQELFEIKQNYHHLWSESQQLYQAMEKHYNSEEGLLHDLKNKIENLTPDHIEDIKNIQNEKKIKKEHFFKDITDVHREIDDLKSVVKDLNGMEKYVTEKSPVAYYNKEVKDFNRILDKIKSENEKLAQFKKIGNSNMIKTTEAVIRSLEQEKVSITKKTVSAILETKKSLEEKIEKRNRIADKYLKIKTIRILVQGLPWSGKFSYIHSLDPFSALQRKGNFSIISAPDYFFNSFKGLLLWVQNENGKRIESESDVEGKLITLPELEENFEKYKERVKVKIEFTCCTGFVDDNLFPNLVKGMHINGLIYIYDHSDHRISKQCQDLYNQTITYLSSNSEFPNLILANKSDLTSEKESTYFSNAHLISIQENSKNVMNITADFIRKIIFSVDEIKSLFSINID
ncbi:MAG: hypothetical protein ACTSVL_06435 [Promethearchaeota archaeon]